MTAPHFTGSKAESGESPSPAVGSVEERASPPPPRTAADGGNVGETTDDVVVYHYDDDGDDDPPAPSGWGALANRNVSRVLVFCFLDGASHSIWRQDPFQVLVKQLGGDEAVGWMAGFAGITQMLAAVVAGYIGNTVKHETVLRFGSIVGFITIAIAMLAAANLNLILFYISQALCGVYAGISATTMEALFADSVATGRRAFVYNLKWMDQVLSGCVGLIISIAVLFHLGNKWEASALVKTMFVGMCLHPVAMAMLWTLRDKYALKDDEEANYGDTDAGKTAVVLTELESCGGAEMTGGDRRVHKSALQVALMHNGLHDDDDAEEEEAEAEVNRPGTAAARTAATEDTPWSSGMGRPLAMRRSGQTEEEDGSGRRVHWSPAPPAVTSSPAPGSPPSSPSAAAAAGTSPASGAATPGGRLPRSTRHKAVQTRLEEECAAAKHAFRTNLLAARGNYVKQLGYTVSYFTSVIVTWEAVPYLVCLVDFLVAFGSGMTMRYMSLFFVEDYKTSPVTLLTASLLISPLTALISFLVQRGGDFYVGRLPSTIIVRLIGTTLLLLMGTTTLPLNIMLPIYIFRNALMNSTAGVTRSVIMDCVRKENRAKWSAFESFSSFTWSGSAVFGGYIAAAHGYKGTFVITALFHYCSLAVMVPGAIGALPVEKELIRTNRTKRHASCLTVTVAVCVILAIASCFYAWFSSEVAKRGW
ncbi:hypothetical protein ABB37_08793 [Leptomonas pyrrhocoris]|uniref:Major facilitator superfamily (MFS) profile domain-containing protein n=1 Tax=Leptomonas pyrrhocoris TaxID=157538 RepID=A0A0M9FSS9_LEPPY|nr:hypothetical protein ABB37_08793 [Leptomonas pyrrhocoris]KPA75126.1 hypothetical protein ABB37_08793 [Leptomonas pyrrhocoris]|eukprot:XP_015653565.1 hypothetical protein ABB37_08793 [Leptomonas pyrrhocoris]